MHIDTGDTAWVLVSTALVMIMTPALALFYGGMVRSKNILATAMQSFVALGVISVLWIFYGYSLAFGPDVHHFIGNLSWAFLNNVGIMPYAAYSKTIPHLLFMLFQMMFAVLTPALITGAFAERFKFKTYLVFLVFWFTFVYCPIAHWVWGQGGWIKNLGGLDFAGGMVVHIASGMSALVATLMIGKRIGWKKVPIHPHNLSLTILGTALLWFGWFGFNAGSALAANGIAVNAFIVSNISAAIAGITWTFIEWRIHGKPTMLGMISGVIAGLATITPAAGFVNIPSALIIGIMAGIICYIFVTILKPKFGYDDSLDAFGVHGVGGILGTLLTGIFASSAVNPAGNGLLFGNSAQFLIQLKATVITIVYSTIMTIIIFKLIDLTIGVRVSEKEEALGLDLSQHKESAYTVIE